MIPTPLRTLSDIVSRAWDGLITAMLAIFAVLIMGAVLFFMWAVLTGRL